LKLLIAEDEITSRRALEAMLASWGHEVVAVPDGAEAWRILQQGDAPKMAILDWMMPGMDGVDVCRKVRELAQPLPPYLILLTSRSRTADVVAGLEAGANDYLTKPFDRDELNARVRVGVRVASLQQSLADNVRALTEALARVKTLQGLLPMCAWCRKIRDDRNYWTEIEKYVQDHSDTQFTHGICPDCREKLEKSAIEEAARREQEAP